MKLVIKRSRSIHKMMRRLTLSLYKGFNVRALRASRIPNIQALSDSDYMGLTGREISPSYTLLVRYFRPGGGTTAAYKDITAADIAASLKARVDDDVTLRGRLLEMEETRRNAEANTSQGNKLPTGANAARIEEFINKMWADTQFPAVLGALHAASGDVTDVNNAVPARIFWDSLDANKRPASKLLDAELAVFHVGNGVKSPSEASLEVPLKHKLNHFEYVMNKDAVNDEHLTISNMILYLSGSKDVAKESSTISGLINVLTDYDLIVNVGNMTALVKTLLGDRDDADGSSNRTLAQLIMELKRLNTVNSVRVFYALQAWICLMQQIIRPLMTTEVLDFIKGSLPSLDGPHDIKGCLDWFMSIKVGGAISDLLDDVPVVGGTQYGGTSYTVVETPHSSSKPERILGTILNDMKVLIPFLYGWKSHTGLWQAYNEGASFVNGKPAKVSLTTSDLNAIPVTFTQHGATLGKAPQKLSEYEDSFLFDWGLNMFNSSVKTAMYARPSVNTDIVEIYAYGHIDYLSYHKKLEDMVIGLHTQKTPIAGVEVSKLSIPALPCARTIRKDTQDLLFVDDNMIDKAPTCMLPLPPLNHVYVMADGAESSLTLKDKVLIGSYESKIESLPMRFFHADPTDKDKRPKLRDSVLNVLLGLNESSMALVAKAPSTVAHRWVDGTDDNGLVCTLMSQDDFLPMAITHFMYIPQNDATDAYYMVFSSTDFITNEKVKIDGLLNARQIDVMRVFTDPASMTVSRVPERLEGSRVDVAKFPGLTRMPDDSEINLRTGIV